MNRLLDKVAIITGADGGICGKASELFCQEGAKIVMCDIDPNVQKKCEEIVAAGGKAVAVTADVGERATWDKLLETALENYGRVDICVNGAAAFSGADWDTCTLEHLRETLRVNLEAVLHSYQTVLKYMVDNQIRGNFLNFSSSTALSYNGSGFCPYPISKASIQNATENMVKQVSPKTGIRFNCLAPNYIWTPKTDIYWQQLRSVFESTTPFPETGMPEDSAWAMVYLCSDEAKYINGVCLPTDGGWLTCN